MKWRARTWIPAGPENATVHQRFEYIDFAKGYAMFTVVCYHALQRTNLPPVLEQAISFGGTGVHLFFLLSGFGLYWSKPSESARQFYIRRLAKIWLPYAFALTISLLAAVFLNLFPSRFDAWLAGVGLYQMFFERYIESFGGHFWFISAIVQCYLAYPALCLLKKKSGDDRIFFAVALGLSAAWWLAVFGLGKGHLRTWNSFFLQFLWEFTLGMVIAARLKTKALPSGAQHSKTLENNTFRIPHSALRMHRSCWFYPLLAVFSMSAMVWMAVRLGEAGKIFNDIPALAGYASVSIILYRAGDEFLPPLKRFFLWMGQFSFSLYLVHVLVLEAYLRALTALQIAPGMLTLAAYLPVAFLAGLAFEQFSGRINRLFFPAASKHS